jgi:hypothetical protein
MKVREEVLSKLIFCEERIKSIEHRLGKKHNFPFIKFEESICRKLTELFTSLAPRDKLKDFRKIAEEALNDATSKIKDCHIEV